MEERAYINLVLQFAADFPDFIFYEQINCLIALSAVAFFPSPTHQHVPHNAIKAGSESYSCSGAERAGNYQLYNTVIYMASSKISPSFSLYSLPEALKTMKPSR